MIVPTVGRVVWFWPARLPNELTRKARDPQPCAATVVYVHSERMVNLSWFDHNGGQHAATSVTLMQDGDVFTPERIDSGYFCQWMPYQVGQAAKTEAVEAQLRERAAPVRVEGSLPT